MGWLTDVAAFDVLEYVTHYLAHYSAAVAAATAKDRNRPVPINFRHLPLHLAFLAGEPVWEVICVHEA